MLILVQSWIDGGGLTESPLHPESLKEIHARFCEGLPEELLVQEGLDGKMIPIIPGAFRDGFVQVGAHIPPSPGAVPRLLDHLHRMFGFQGKTGKIIYAACAHHRLVWIHPFPDLNGRVSRMVAHAMLAQSVSSAGLWSASRGLGRNAEEYKRRLAAADAPRPGGADGRGALSEARLAEFASFFLEKCIDQVEFMHALMRPAELRSRVMEWAVREERRGQVLKGSDRILGALLMEGEIDRGVIPNMLGVSDRQARKVTSRLLELEAIESDSPRAPLKVHFPASLASSWMPGLFPER